MAAPKRKRTDESGGKSKKSKSLKNREEPAALPEGVDDNGAEDSADFIALAEEDQKPAAVNGKKDKKSKDKKSKSNDDTAATTQDDTPKKSKKEKKSAKKATEAEAKVEGGEEAAAAEENQPAASGKSKKNKKKNKDAEEAGEGGGQQQAATKQKQNRFIVFVGNLPFTANESTIRQHFASVKPASVRCLTKDGKENTCRGFAFIEFSNPTNMRTCLDKMHHTLFNDGVSPGRKINVELTAGGGGAKENRKEKIKARNQQLEVNRLKRIEKENNEKRAKAGAEPVDFNGIHPSRRGQIE